MGVTGAEALNDKWEALSARFDLLKSVPPDKAAVLNATIAEWQDWFWGVYGDWPSTELLSWQDRYVKAAQLLDGLAKKTVVVKSVKQTDNYQAPKPVPVKLPPLLVTAKPPEPPPYIPPPPIVYKETPYLPPPPAQSTAFDFGHVNTRGWSKTNWGKMKRYQLANAGSGWSPTGAEVREDKKGLIALVVAIGAAYIGRLKGWL